MKVQSVYWLGVAKRLRGKNSVLPVLLGVMISGWSAISFAQTTSSETVAETQTLSAVIEPAMSPIQHHLMIPPSTMVKDGLQPASVLKLGIRDRYLLVASLSEGVLHVFEKLESGLKKIQTMPVSIGKKGFGKRVEGDKKTPVGVYRIISHLTDQQLDDFYGHAAYPVNYPNVWDRLKKRTGSGIWLHAMPEGTQSRPALDSDGCVVVTNENIDAIAPYLDVGYTKIVLTDKAQWQTPEVTAQRRQPLEQAIDGWRLAWESRQSIPYLSFYADDFSDFNKNKAQWSRYKKRINDRKKYIKVAISDLSLFKYPGEENLYLAEFFQTYRSSNYNSNGWKRQLWRMTEQGGWQIVFEGGG